MPEFKIAVDLGHLIPHGSPFTRDTFPNLAHAVAAIAEGAHAQWQHYASGAPMPNGLTIHSRTGEYQRSIVLRQTGDFSAEVFSALAYARIIEEGAPSYDMKRMLNTSLKVRLTKNGRRYLIIPFRHNTPGSVMGANMPIPVHNWWRGKDPSHITGTYQEASGTGAWNIKTRAPEMVTRRKYQWGAKLSGQDLHGLGVGEAAAKRLQGMVMFRKPGGTGGSAHSQFLTFRIMMEGGKGWIAPAQPAKHPAKQTADMFRPLAEEAFKRAVEADVRRILGGQ